MSYGDDNLILKGWEAGKFSKARKKISGNIIYFMHSFEALHVENVVRSTLSYPNEASKECIQFL
jgi:hypothetical protein